MEKYGFVYIWYDKKFKRYYIGCHWGTIDDGYICSSSWMKKSFKNRPTDFKRRILKTNIEKRLDMYIHEQYYLNMIKKNEIKPSNVYPRYYNLSLSSKNPWHQYPESVKTVGAKISAAKTGKSVPAPPSRGKAISAAKKGKVLTDEHKAALTGIKKGLHTDQWKEDNSQRFKLLWADPEFKAKQSEARKAAWVKRKEKINNNELIH